MNSPKEDYDENTGLGLLGCGKKHRWAINWLKAHNWRSEAWAIYALRAEYNSRYDAGHAIPARVRALAEDVWRDLRAARISSTTTILDYEADLSLT